MDSCFRRSDEWTSFGLPIPPIPPIPPILPILPILPINLPD